MIDRELLEATALRKICACRYYDLADYIDITADNELRALAGHKVICETCRE